MSIAENLIQLGIVAYLYLFDRANFTFACVPMVINSLRQVIRQYQYCIEFHTTIRNIHRHISYAGSIVAVLNKSTNAFNELPAQLLKPSTLV
jgi:hypothetical protein